MKTIHQNERCLTCGRYPSRGLSVDAVIIHDRRILLVKRGRDPFKGSWALPGGYVDFHEKVEDALRREVLEETHLKVTSLRLVNIYSDPKRHPEEVMTVAYLVDTEGIPEAGDDAAEVAYFPLEQLPIMAFDHRLITDDAVRLIN